MSARPGSPGSRTRSASGAVGRRWMGERGTARDHRLDRVMAKKKDKKSAKQPGRADAVRSAVDQAFQATAEQAETARGRAADIVDEFTQAAIRVRDVLEELRPPTGDELRDLKEQVAALEQRVKALEAKGATTRRTTTRRTTAKKADS